MTSISKPKNSNNAIEAAQFVVVLQQPLHEETIKKINVALDTVIDKLPGVQPSMQQGFVVQFGGMMNSPFNEVLRFSSARNGAHEWRVQVMGNLVQVSCLKFDDFAAVWQDAESYLRLVLAQVDASAVVQEVGYQVVDKFEYDEGMSADDYDMAELFQADCPYLTPQSWKSGLLWHVYQGWFAPHDENTKLLHQLNVSNTDIAPQRIGCIIDHRVAARSSTDKTLTVGALLAQEPGSPEMLNNLFTAFHRENLGVISTLLTPAKLQTIGMKVSA